jgi:hypothetical protein
MASKPLSVFKERRRRRHGSRPTVCTASLVLVAPLALVGPAAVALLVLGPLDVDAVTRHFSVR